MYNLVDESLFFRTRLHLKFRILSDRFNEVLSVMWHILKLCIFVYIMTCIKRMVTNTAVGRELSTAEFLDYTTVQATRNPVFEREINNRKGIFENKLKLNLGIEAS